MYLGPHVEGLLFLLDFKLKRNALIYFSKVLTNELSRKSLPCEVECSIRKDGRTDITTRMMWLKVDFRSFFANDPKNEEKYEKIVTYLGLDWKII
jgi:hypothetical protein